MVEQFTIENFSLIFKIDLSKINFNQTILLGGRRNIAVPPLMTDLNCNYRIYNDRNKKGNE